MIVYVQKDESGHVVDDIEAAYKGAKKLGCNIKFFTDPEQVPFRDDVMVLGYIEDTIKYFEINNLIVPKPLNIPKSLLSFVDREIKYITMGEFRENVTVPIFIKPNDKVKSFTSGVIQDKSSVITLLYDIEDSRNIMTSEVVEILTEYRCFVNKGELIGIKHYQGDFKKYINIETVECLINSYIDSPICYTLDVGLDDKGNTILIECNDAWSIGDYGLEPVLFFQLLRDRWFEIIR